MTGIAFPGLAIAGLGQAGISRQGIAGSGLGFAGRGGGAAASLYLGHVATNTRTPSQTSAGNKMFMSRSPHFARTAINDIAIRIPNWFSKIVSNNDVETGSGGTATFTASVEYPAGTFTQFLFSGSASVVAADLSTVQSDTAIVSIPKDALFWIRIWCNAVGGIVYNDNIYVSNGANLANGKAFNFAVSGIVDQTMSGTVTNLGGAAGVNTAMPLSIIGNTRAPAVYLLGDSRGAGRQDTYDAANDTGELARSVGGTLNYHNAGVSSATLNGFVAGHALQGAEFAYFTHSINERGINDIVALLLSVTTMKARLITTWQALPGKVFQITLPPESTSTDLWTTLAGQTTNTHENVRVPINDWIRDGAPMSGGVGVATGTVGALRAGDVGHPLTGWFEVADAVESSRNSGLWKTDEVTPRLYCFDGIHEVQFGYLAIKNFGGINPALIHR